MPDSMVFYSSFSSAIKRLPPEEQLKALWSILDYGLDGKEPEEDGLFMMIFDMAKPQIDANTKRKANGSNGWRPKKTDGYENKKPLVSDTKTNGYENKKPNVNVNENDNANVNVNAKKESRAHFVPPTLENVIGYCQENGYSVDAQRFIDFYESKGWMVGKNKMKDWKAAVRNWSRQEKEGKNPAKKNQFNNFPQRTYDFEEYEKKLLNQGK